MAASPARRAARRRVRRRPDPRAWRLAIVAVVAAAVGARPRRSPIGRTAPTRITVLDVGQGDAILVEGGRGGRMLVDGGPDPDRLLVELDRRLPPWDRRIDILVLTHPHEDHVAGLPLLLERYRIGRVYETGHARARARLRGAGRRALERPGAPPTRLLATGRPIALDGIRFRVLWPDPGRVPREPPDAGRGINDVSIVLLGEVGGRRFLLTGDVEDDVDPLLASRGLPPVDILKVAHHGSATASTPAFLDAVRPRGRDRVGRRRQPVRPSGPLDDRASRAAPARGCCGPTPTARSRSRSIRRGLRSTCRLGGRAGRGAGGVGAAVSRGLVHAGASAARPAIRCPPTVR